MNTCYYYQDLLPGPVHAPAKGRFNLTSGIRPTRLRTGIASGMGNHAFYTLSLLLLVGRTTGLRPAHALRIPLSFAAASGPCSNYSGFFDASDGSPPVRATRETAGGAKPLLRLPADKKCCQLLAAKLVVDGPHLQRPACLHTHFLAVKTGRTVRTMLSWSADGASCLNLDSHLSLSLRVRVSITRTLAHMLDSSVRVTRRVNYKHFASILGISFNKRTPCGISRNNLFPHSNPPAARNGL